MGDPETEAKQRRDLRAPSDAPRVLAIERRSARNDSVREQHVLLWHAAAATSGNERVVVNEEGLATFGSDSEPMLKVARRHAEAIDRAWRETPGSRIPERQQRPTDHE